MFLLIFLYSSNVPLHSLFFVYAIVLASMFVCHVHFTNCLLTYLFDTKERRLFPQQSAGETRKVEARCFHIGVSVHSNNNIRFTALFQDHPGEPVPEENFWSLWCKGRLTEADTLTIRLDATPSGLTSAHLHHPAIFFTTRMPFLPPNQQCQSTEGTVVSAM